MTEVSTPEVVAALIFGLAVLHTFSTKLFAHLAHSQPRHAGLWHLLSEVEVVFGFWAFILVVVLFALTGRTDAVDYMESRNFTEPMFVFVIMVIAASRPVLQFGSLSVRFLSVVTPLPNQLASFFICLSVVPLLGSFITEPAAMTLAALMLRDRFFRAGLSSKLMYGILGVLFVNISIGGTLTSFGAPPVLMVAAKWQWNTAFMLTTFGWKAALAVVINAALLTAIFRRELMALKLEESNDDSARVPVLVILIHLAFLVAVVAFAHHPAVFMGLFLFFLGYTEAYERYQDRLILREGLLVAFFLGGLVVLGGLQQWWLQDTLLGVEPGILYFLAIALTAVTDNAALTYLASLVEGVSPAFQYAIVAGAVTGGGLTIIANAPNPAGVAILKGSFDEGAISPLALFLAALAPTTVAVLAFLLL